MVGGGGGGRAPHLPIAIAWLALDPHHFYKNEKTSRLLINNLFFKIYFERSYPLHFLQSLLIAFNVKMHHHQLQL